MPLSPESAVKKLSRLPSNCICANCGTRSQFGFSTVCIKYLTFVCNACKSSHQAISHRCKSLTMSSWDQGEVLKLKTHGNDYARKVWLGNAPPVGSGGRPREGDNINVFKRFVVEAYEKKRYYVEPSADGGEERAEEARNAPFPTPHANHAPRRPVETMAKKPAAPPKQRRRPPAPAPAPPPAAAVDLLDFGAFDNAVSPPAPSTYAQTSPVVNTLQAPSSSNTAPSPDPFFESFNGSSQNSNAASNMMNGNAALDTNNVNASQSSSNHDSLQPSNDGSSTTQPPFDPFGGSSIISATSSGTNNHEQQTSHKVVMKAPVMNNSGGVMHGGMANNNHSHMMMNGGMMGNNSNNPIMANGGMMNSGNPMVMNGGVMANNSMMNTGNNGMAMNGGMGGMMNSNNAMMMSGGMMNSNNMMMMNGGMMNNNMMMMNGSMNSNSGMYGNANQKQQQQPSPSMNVNIMQPMNNSISQNFGARSASAGGKSKAAATNLNKKSDPFAGLGF